MGLIADQGAAIAAILSGVPNSGVVFDYQPLPRNDWAGFVGAFKSTVAGRTHIRAWMVVYLGERRERRSLGMGANGAKTARETRWLVRGLMSWDDPDTDAEFRDLVETVATALDANRSLGGTALDHDPVTVNLPQNAAGVLLGDILCHNVEMTFEATAEELVTYA